MIKSFIFAVSLFLYFFISDLLLVPLRKVPNYNLFLLILFSLAFLILVYKAVTSGSQAKRLIYGSFGGLVLWSLIGEICPSLRVHPASLLNPICAVDIKHPSAAIYLALLLMSLSIAYITGAIKDGLAMMLAVFGSTWSFELYMQNYSARVPHEALPAIAYTLGGISLVVLLLAFFMTIKSTSPAGKTFWGYWIYYGLVTTLTSFFILPHPMLLGF